LFVIGQSGAVVTTVVAGLANRFCEIVEGIIFSFLIWGKGPVELQNFSIRN
jgi:hypothetical protein